MTDEQVAEILAQKKANPDMTRVDVKRMLGEASENKKKRSRTAASNWRTFSPCLQDTGRRWTVAKAMRRHMRDEFAASARALADKEAAASVESTNTTSARQAGLSNMEKDLADKDKKSHGSIAKPKR